MGKFDLNPDEMKKFDLSPEELRQKSKYSDPKSFSQTDQELGLETGPTIVPSSNFGRVTSGYPGMGGHEDPIGPVMRKHADDLKVQALKEFAKEVGAQSAGGALTAGIGAGINPKTAVNALAPNALSNFAKSGDTNFIKAFLNYWSKKTLGEEAAQIAARNMGKVIPAVKSAALDAGSGAGTAQGFVQEGVRALSQGSSGEPKPFKGVMSNQIDRLRQAAVSDARARDLLNRIEGTNETAGTVTQSTGVE